MKTQEALESFKARLHSPFFPGQDPTAFLNRATDPIFELARDLSTPSASDQRTALPSSRISPSRDAAPTQPFHITGSSAPEYAEAFRVAVRRDPSLRTSSFTALVDAANVGHTEDAVRTVARAIEKVTGWKYTPRDVGAFIAVLFVAVGEEVPS